VPSVGYFFSYVNDAQSHESEVYKYFLDEHKLEAIK